MKAFDIIVIGTGPGGLSAGLYAGRYMLKAACIGKSFGGEAGRAGTVWNYPGVKAVDGMELAMVMREQAEEVGTAVIDANVESVKNNNGCFEVMADGELYTSRALIIASGAERRHLGLVNEKEMHGRGVHYCVTCDGPLYKDKVIAIAGGGDASVKGTNLACEYAKKIYLIVRDPEIIAEPVNHEQMKKLGDRVEVLLNTTVSEIVTDGSMQKIEKLILSREYNGSKELPVDAFFIEIGAQPGKKFPESLGLETDESGYIKVNANMETNVKGVYAVGDATNFFGRFKQNITAAAMGAVAATSAYSHIKAHPHLCEVHWRDIEKDK